MEPIPPTDLTRRPPRSPRVRLGGYALLPRIIDKGRATTAGTNGDYNYACPFDTLFFEFTSISPEDFKVQIDAGLGDGELLEWVGRNAGARRAPHEITLWSRFIEDRVPSDVETREYFVGLHKAAGASRKDIATWCDLLDMDDFGSFGGKI